MRVHGMNNLNDTSSWSRQKDQEDVLTKRIPYYSCKVGLTLPDEEQRIGHLFSGLVPIVYDEKSREMMLVGCLRKHRDLIELKQDTFTAFSDNILTGHINFSNREKIPLAVFTAAKGVFSLTQSRKVCFINASHTASIDGPEGL